MASAAAIKFSHVVVAVHQAKSCCLNVHGGKKQIEEKEAQEERVVFVCFSVHGVRALLMNLFLLGEAILDRGLHGHDWLVHREFPCECMRYMLMQDNTTTPIVGEWGAAIRYGPIHF